MSDEVNAKRHRRRHRSRKKKAPETIGSILPGRAPLGFCLASPRSSNPLVSPSKGRNATRRTEARQEDTPSRSPASDLISKTPEPRLSTSTPDPLPRTQSSLSSPSSISQVEPGGIKKVAAKYFFSPPTPKTHRCVSTMSARKLSFRPRSRMRAARSRSTATVEDVDYEMESLEGLASSRPIPLSALCGRASSRNKGPKSCRSMQVDGGSASDESVNNPITNVLYSDYKPRSSLSAMYYSNSEESSGYSHRDIPELYGPRDRRAYRSEPIGEAWSGENNARIQHNPLSYSVGYGSPYHVPHSRGHSYVSESPFSRNDNYFRSEPHGWTDRYMVSGGDMVGMVQQPGPYHQRPYSVPESSYQVYGANFGRPYTPSRHGSAPYQTHDHHSHVDFYQPSHTLQYSFTEPHHEQYIAYEHGYRSEDFRPVFEDTETGVASANSVGSSSQNQLPKILSPESSNQIQDSSMADGKLTKSDAINHSRGNSKSNTKEEVAAFLKTVVQKANINVKQTTLHDPFVEAKASLVNEQQKAHSSDEAPLQTKPGKHAASKSSTSPKSESEKEAFKILCQTAAIESQTSQDHVIEKNIGPSETPAENGKSVPGKILRPPPGLPMPTAQDTELQYFAYGQNSMVHKERLEEADSWFRKDGRGEEQLRQHIAEIARDHAEKWQTAAAIKLHEQNKAKQMTQLVGDVIANLQSYVSGDRTKQTGNFANFGEVEPRAYEPSHGGRRSYFDLEPSIDQWRLPSGRAHTVLGKRPVKELL